MVFGGRDSIAESDGIQCRLPPYRPFDESCPGWLQRPSHQVQTFHGGLIGVGDCRFREPGTVRGCCVIVLINALQVGYQGIGAWDQRHLSQRQPARSALWAVGVHIDVVYGEELDRGFPSKFKSSRSGECGPQASGYFPAWSTARTPLLSMENLEIASVRPLSQSSKLSGHWEIDVRLAPAHKHWFP